MKKAVYVAASLRFPLPKPRRAPDGGAAWFPADTCPRGSAAPLCHCSRAHNDHSHPILDVQQAAQLTQTSGVAAGHPRKLDALACCIIDGEGRTCRHLNEKSHSLHLSADAEVLGITAYPFQQS